MSGERRVDTRRAGTRLAQEAIERAKLLNLLLERFVLPVYMKSVYNFNILKCLYFATSLFLADV